MRSVNERLSISTKEKIIWACLLYKVADQSSSSAQFCDIVTNYCHKILMITFENRGRHWFLFFNVHEYGF
jgi:hypothetical protein